MSTLPSDPRKVVDFAQAHLDAWQSNQANIGITAQQLTTFEAALIQAKGSSDAAKTARSASLAATEEFYNDAGTLRDTAAAIVRSVRAFARNSENPSVYTLAEIPAPQQPGPAEPPGQPFEIRAEVTSLGALVLRWKNSNPRGVANVVYEIQRSLNGTSGFDFLANTGGKTFTDSTVPAGSMSVSYIITGKRGLKTGQPSAIFTAMFGTASGGGGAGLQLLRTFSTPEDGMGSRAAA